MRSGNKSTAKARSRSAQSNASSLGDMIVERIEKLAGLTDQPGELTRLYLGPAHRRSVDLVSAWMREAGMAVRLDSVATVVGRYEAVTNDAPALLLGSHIDTVRNAGRYDGTLGVLAAIAVIHRLHAANRRLPFAIEVVAFGDEEGVRFAGTLTGSRALASRFDPKLLDEVDRDGVSRRQALMDFGCDVDLIASEARDPVRTLGYLEVHIEQGPVLEAENLPLAVVTAINGATRGSVTVTGVGGHAGTVPMELRRDAIAATAEMILAVERRAASEPELVATVGMVDVASGALNAVPGEVTFSLDVRSPSDDRRKAAIGDLERELKTIARRRGVKVKLMFTYEAASATCDAGLTKALAASIERMGLAVRHLPSGAGHDAMAFKDRIRFAMLFVRCRGGISHNPAEFTSADDIDFAARVLADCVETLEFSR